jgi:excisionase family DNA binding protein
MERFLTLNEMAEFLSVSTSTLRREVKAGRIPFVKIGRVYRFSVGHVLSSLAANVGAGSRHGAAFEPKDAARVDNEAPAGAQRNRPEPVGPEDGQLRLTPG